MFHPERHQRCVRNLSRTGYYNRSGDRQAQLNCGAERDVELLHFYLAYYWRGGKIISKSPAPFMVRYPPIRSILGKGGQTTLTATVLYPSKEVRDIVIETGMEHGAAESYDKLAELLAEDR
jgi:hypothetical protein